jgi:ribosomal protein S18 acetylase RimI-like enzyme
MIPIRPLPHFDAERFKAIASGYTTSAIYQVEWLDSEPQAFISLTREALPEPRTFRFPHSDDELAHYRAIVPGEYCLAAYDGDLVVAVAIAEAQGWNNVLWVWDFHVAEAYRGQGIGRELMEKLAVRASAAGLRAIVCETQNTNVPAIDFYRAVDFAIEGVDISYYTNEDMRPGGTVAVFMKRRLG